MCTYISRRQSRHHSFLKSGFWPDTNLTAYMYYRRMIPVAVFGLVRVQSEILDRVVSNKSPLLTIGCLSTFGGGDFSLRNVLQMSRQLRSRRRINPQTGARSVRRLNEMSLLPGLSVQQKVVFQSSSSFLYNVFAWKEKNGPTCVCPS